MTALDEKAPRKDDTDPGYDKNGVHADVEESPVGSAGVDGPGLHRQVR
jgi:hypothetical protein